MANYNYNSRLILAKNILIDKAHKNVLNYNTNAMLNLLRSAGHLVGEASNYSFIQKGKISAGFTYNQCLTANYIAFQNPNYSSKWFFAFIDKVEYESNKSTIIYYTIDNWATWFDNLIFKPCYVIREHTNDDAIGANTIDEGLAVPEVEQVNIVETNEIDQALYICVATNWDPSVVSSSHQASGVTDSDGEGYNGMSMFNNNTFGSKLCLFTFNNTGLDNLKRFLLATNRQGHINDVHDMFIVPACIFTNQTDLINESFTFYYYRFSTSPIVEFQVNYKVVSYMSSNRDKVFSYNIEYTPNYDYGDYTVKNNKCYCFPYNYLMVTNNVGNQNIYKLEEFDDVEDFEPGDKILQIQMSLSIGMSGRIVPVRYKGRHFDFDNALTLAKFPTCSWSADSYTNWLTQQSVNSSNAGLSVAADVVSGGNLLAGVVVSAASEIATFYGGYKKAQLLPEITSGQSTGDVNFGNHNNHFTLVQYRIKLEHLRQIDDYFSRFGYKTLRVKTPNIIGRSNYNYIEIGQGERFAYGEVPPEALNEINQTAQNGLTIWHNHNNVGNFNVSNTIV